MKRATLDPDEIRFLRKYLGFSGAGFAAAVGASKETISRWENGKAKMNTAAERSLRLMVFVQPQITDYPDVHRLSEIESAGQPLKVRANYSKKKNWTTVVDAKKALLAVAA
jgi:transcriptional regulator with XRE-family HTH domain